MAVKRSDAIGIDLGTTYSAIAFSRNGRAETIVNPEGRKTTPSVVAFVGEDRVVGSQAFNQAQRSPKSLVYDSKRLMGKLFDDKSVQEDMKGWSFKVKKGIKGRPSITCESDSAGEIQISPEEVAGIILRELKGYAEMYLEHEIRDCVITVPASFDESQRKATMDAAKIADLNCLRLLNEPTAAAVAYGVKRDEEGTVLIFDLGGGTFDATVLTIKEGVYEVTGTGGDPHLGGKDLDALLVTFIMTQFNKNKLKTANRVEIEDKEHAESRNKLFKAVEDAKIALSSSPQTVIFVGSFTKSANGKYVDLNVNLTRAGLEKIARPLVKRCINITEELLRSQNVDVKDVDKVVLVGGFTKMPLLHSQLKEKFGDKVSQGINPDEAVALGAAMMAELISQENSEEKGLPKLLVDVTPLALGIELEGGTMSKIIQSNTPIPTTQEDIYTTSYDDQTSVKIVVFQGNRTFVRDNKKLGFFKLEGIPKMKKGDADITVKFSISEDGILSIEASENSSGTTNSLSISKDQVGGLSELELMKMVEDGKKYAEIDQKKKEIILEKEKLERIISENEDRYPGNEEFAKKLQEISDWLEEGEDKEVVSVIEKREMLETYILEIEKSE